MAKFLIEVPHEGTKAACMRAIQLFKETGSHFLSHAEWGCTDGEHKAWMIVEIDNKDAAKRILPSALRNKAKITLLHQFSRREGVGDKVMEHHS